MPEQSAQEKMEDVYKLQIQLQERRIREIEESYQRALEIERQDHMEQRKAAVEVFNERRQELIHQNDGMLGAIGRIHTENEKLKTEASDLTAAVLDLGRKLEAEKKQASMDAQRAEQIIQLVKEKSQAEIQDLKAKLYEKRGRPAKGRKA
jgi:hypothetical protein